MSYHSVLSVCHSFAIGLRAPCYLALWFFSLQYEIKAGIEEASPKK